MLVTSALATAPQTHQWHVPGVMRCADRNTCHVTGAAADAKRGCWALAQGVNYHMSADRPASCQWRLHVASNVCQQTRTYHITGIPHHRMPTAAGNRDRCPYHTNRHLSKPNTSIRHTSHAARQVQTQHETSPPIPAKDGATISGTQLGTACRAVHNKQAWQYATSPWLLPAD